MTSSRMPTAVTSSHDDLVAAGAIMGEVGGWAVPLHFTGPDAEIEAARTRAGITEQGHLAKLRLQEDDVSTTLHILGTPIPVGGASRVSLAAGGIDMMLQVARLSPGEAWITGPAGSQTPMRRSIETLGGSATVFDVTSTFSSFGLVGPRAEFVLSALTELDMRDSAMPDGSCAQTMLAGIYGLVVRSDLGTVPAYSIFFGREYGLYMWDVVTEAGRACDTAMIGSEALEALGRGR